MYELEMETLLRMTAEENSAYSFLETLLEEEDIVRVRGLKGITKNNPS